MRVFSFGGGRQSMSVLVLAAQGRVQYDAFLFSNVGEKAENPDTLRYFREVALPFAQANGIELVEVARRRRSGEIVDLYDYNLSNIRSIAMPVYMQSGAPGNRTCTVDWKIKVISRWTKQHGATPDNPATIGLGISLDEYQRIKDSSIKWQIHEWPLIELRMTLEDCRRVVRDAGLPEPPKSSCWFCPFKRHSEWLKMRQERPDLFEKAVQLERRINEKRDAMGRDIVHLHRSLRPLDEIGEQMVFDFEDTCESGYCMI